MALRAILLCACLVPLATAADLYTWRELPELPEPLGVAGAFVGVSNGALVVAGGAHFRVSPFEGGQKIWVDRIFVLEDREGQWQAAGRLKAPLAYGVSISTPDGIVCIGGSDSARHHRDVFRLTWNNGRIEQTDLRDLPRSSANMSGALLDGKIYVAAGQESPMAASPLHEFWSLELARPEARCRLKIFPPMLLGTP